MRFLSLCSGIEAASVAWVPLGWECVGVSEIEAFPSAVLAHHYPGVVNFGDLNNYHEWTGSLRPELVVAGTPCQAFSVAGLRKGLEDPRGNLSLVFLGVLERLRPRWVVWENVPGVLSDKTGAFGALLGGLGELGYGFAYRVLDAQYFGVAQRRRRVFVVGCLGDWRAAAAVLFEPEGLRGDPAPRREPGKGTAWDVAPCLAASGRGFERTGDTRGQDCVVPEVSHALRGEGFDASEDGTARGTPLVPVSFQPGNLARERCGAEPSEEVFPSLSRHPGDQLPHVAVPVAFNARQDPDVWQDRTGPLDTDGSTQAIAFAQNQMGEVRAGEVVGTLNTNSNASGRNTPMVAFSCKDYGADAGDLAPTLRAMGHGESHANAGGQVAMVTGMQVRRLTPRECERLQGFPDDYTRIAWRGNAAEVCPDGPRYKALGNSMAVPVMRWIGEGIAAVNGWRGW